MLLLHNGRRAHLDVSIQKLAEDGSKPPEVDISMQVLPEGRRLPDFASDADPVGGWRTDVELLNELPFNAWQSREPSKAEAFRRAALGRAWLTGCAA